MELIKAYIKDLNVPLTAVMGAPALGDVISYQRLEIPAKVGRTHTKMVKIEMICPHECVKGIRDTVPGKGGVM